MGVVVVGHAVFPPLCGWGGGVHVCTGCPHVDGEKRHAVVIVPSPSCGWGEHVLVHSSGFENPLGTQVCRYRTCMNLSECAGGSEHGACVKGERREHTLGARLACTLGGVGMVDNLKGEGCLLGR